jgi:hypothetical protein
MTAAQETSHYRICPLCEACCGLEVRTADGKVTAIRGAENDVFSRGYICPKAVALKDLHEDPDRLRTPMISAYAMPRATRRCRDSAALAADPGGTAATRHLAFGNPAAHKMGFVGVHAAPGQGAVANVIGVDVDQMPNIVQRADVRALARSPF